MRLKIKAITVCLALPVIVSTLVFIYGPTIVHSVPFLREADLYFDMIRQDLNLRFLHHT